MKDIWGAMADPTRRQILTLLQKRDMTAGEIGEQFEVSGATISHHLKILREAELITAEKEKQTITYSLNTTVFQEFLKGIAAAFHQGGDDHEN
ncbi:MAG: winged helix-turn-helix transcriptional regulator [Oscillospiraceae bacterium]|nr:winged helix-turn-helix transcriptional regulator [Oscillospiraceae bacterium]